MKIQLTEDPNQNPALDAAPHSHRPDCNLCPVAESAATPNLEPAQNMSASTGALGPQSLIHNPSPAAPELGKVVGVPEAINYQPSTLIPSSPSNIPPPSTLNPQLCFPRFPGETPRAFSAFITWFQLGHARSHQAVADKLGEGLPTVRNWSSKYDWSDRLLAFNAGLLQQHAAGLAEQQRNEAAEWAARLNRFREQEWTGALKLLRAAECFLENFGDDDLSKMTLSHAARALRISSDVGRSALAGLELPLAAEPAMSPIQQQMLDALERLGTGDPVAQQVTNPPSSAPPLPEPTRTSSCP